jgi:hypothetical protein
MKINSSIIPPRLIWANIIPSTAPRGIASPLAVLAHLKNVSGVDFGKSDLKSLLIIVSPLGDKINI